MASSFFYHEYSCRNVLCESSKWNAKQVFNLMLTSTKFIAPTDQNVPVANGMIVQVDVLGRKNNPISVTVQPNLLSVVNRTLRGHILHPGSVTRHVIEQSGHIIMDTKGVGSGWIQGSFNVLNLADPKNMFLPPEKTPSGAVNDLAAARVWGKVDALLKARIHAVGTPPA